MKPILSILLITLLSTSLLSDETKKETQKIEEKQAMTDEEFLKKFMELDKEVEEAKAKTKALEQLEKKVDELAKTLGVDK